MKKSRHTAVTLPALTLSLKNSALQIKRTVMTDKNIFDIKYDT